jgi:soluble lytic murein transglycosylase-like protein
MSAFRKGVTLSVSILILLMIALSMISTGAKPIVAAEVVPETHSPEFQKAFFEASKVYGRAGCGDQALAEMTARRAIATGLPVQVIAAMAATESTCNPLAVSNRGAIGLSQVMPKVWSKEFDFTKINLFNPEENMEVSTTILQRLVKEHGLKNGLLRYYGTGNDGIGLGGAGYADRVLQLAGKL